MNQITAMAIGGLAMVAASAAHGQERNTPVADANSAFGIGQDAVGSPPAEPRSSPLFTFGGLNIRVWAPVEPHYSADANRNLAGEPLWHMNELAGPAAFRTTRPRPGEFSSPQSVAAIARE
jgi:hypothetical protein